MKTLILIVSVAIWCGSLPAYAQDKTVIDTTKSPQVPVKMHNNGDGSYSQANVNTDGSGNVTPSGTPTSPTYTTSVLATGTTGQVKIAVTGTAVQFTATPFTLINGITYCAASTNTAAITVGLGSGVNATADGTGNGEVLQAGQCGSKAVNSPSVLYVNGTAGNWLSYGGN